jgi:hypothetical protein
VVGQSRRMDIVAVSDRGNADMKEKENEEVKDTRRTRS